MTPLVSIIMGSTSDLPVMEKAACQLDELAIPFEILALSAHRTPDEVAQFAREAEARGVRVIIAGAGMAAHLCGVIASMTPLPVIGVPIKATLDGMDALLATCCHRGNQWSSECSSSSGTNALAGRRRSYGASQSLQRGAKGKGSARQCRPQRGKVPLQDQLKGCLHRQ